MRRSTAAAVTTNMMTILEVIGPRGMDVGDIEWNVQLRRAAIRRNLVKLLKAGLIDVKHDRYRVTTRGYKMLINRQRVGLMSATMKVKLSAGIVQVLSLDDSCMRSEMQIEVHSAGRGKVVIEATREQMGRFALSCAAAEFYVGENWYARSAHAAWLTVSKALISTQEVK